MTEKLDPEVGELMACPFCGQRPVLTRERMHGDLEPSISYRYHCPDLGGLSTARYDDISDAQFHWNVLISNIKIRRLEESQRQSR